MMRRPPITATAVTTTAPGGTSDSISTPAIAVISPSATRKSVIALPFFEATHNVYQISRTSIPNFTYERTFGQADTAVRPAGTV
jgi:hypothetical protein